MSKRINYEVSGDEDSWVEKCLKCKHSYTKTKQSDILFCSLKICKYEKIKLKGDNENE